MESWNDIAGIHFILVFDETETIHELDLLDFGIPMLGEVGLHLCLGSSTRKVA